LPMTSVNQTLPSGPEAMPYGEPLVGKGYSVIAPPVWILPILLR